MSDDVDLRVYTDSGFTTEVAGSPVLPYGRTFSESITDSSSTDYYIAVEGGNTGMNSEGARYSIYVRDMGNAFENCNFNDGTIDTPRELLPTMNISAPWVYRSLVASAGTSYYRAAVETGIPCMVKIDSALVTQLYSDQFSTPVPGQPYTPASSPLYFNVTGGSGCFYMEVLRKEGSATDPVLLPRDRTNYGRVDNTASHYLFEVVPGTKYIVSTAPYDGYPLLSDVGLSVYDDGIFGALAGTSSTFDTSIESVTVTPTTNLLSVKVEDKSITGMGGSFILTAKVFPL